MAAKPANVFGVPIHNPNQTPIQNAQRARSEKTDGRKYIEALEFVQNLNRQSSNGVSALCLIYNATGSTLTFSESKNWIGELKAFPYPHQIQNGQWAAFLHTNSPVVGTLSGTGSKAAVVYRRMDGKTESKCDYMISWMHPGGNKSNAVSTEINVPDYFKGEWDRINKNLENDLKQQDACFWKQHNASISTGNESTAVVEATFMLNSDGDAA